MEKSTKIILYSTLGLVVAGSAIAIAYYVRRSNNNKRQIGAVKRTLNDIFQGDKVSDEKLKEMIAAANKAGWDIFQDVSFDTVKEYYGNASNLDVDRFITLIKKLGTKKEANWTAIEKAEFKAAWEKMTGKSLPKS